MLSLFAQSEITTPTASSTSINFRQLTIKDGLADNWVHGALMDSKGIMWFATHDGLSRYDGHQFKNYKVNKQIPNSLPGAVLMDIAEGQNGIYWIACNGMGLLKFDSKEETFFAYTSDSTNTNSLSYNSTVTIFTDMNKEIWIGTFGGGLNRLEPSSETFTRYSMTDEDIAPENGFMKNSVRHIIQDPQDQGKLWLGTHNGIYHFDKKTGTKINYPLVKNNQPAFAVSILVDDSGILWIATENNGLIKFDTQTKEATFQQTPLHVKTVLQKSPSELWVATMGSGIGILNTATEEIQFITKENSGTFSILSNDIYGLYLDHQDRLWVRDQSLGLSISKSSGTLFFQPKMPKAVKDELIQTKQFAYSKINNELYVSSFNVSEIFVYKKLGDHYHFYKTLTLPIPEDWRNRILDIFTDSKNRTWYLTQTANAILLFQHNYNSGQIETYPLSELEEIDFKKQTFANIIEDKRGKIWLSFATGELWGLNNGSVDKKSFGRNLSKSVNPEIWKVIVDHENNFWATTLNQGVFYLNQEQDEEIHYPYRFDGGLQGWRVLSIVEAQKGKVWVGTSAAGIQVIDATKGINQEIPIIDQNNGLPDDKINGLVVDKNKNIWIMTMRGLIKYNPLTEHFRLFGREDGLEITALNTGFEQLSNGDIMIGQPFGFLHFTPSKLNDSKEPHPVMFSSFLVNGKPYTTNPSIQHIDKIELAPEENYFSVKFSANYYDDQDQIRYRYFLENYDREWTTAAPGMAQANFTNVPPGHYVFKVLASDSDGNWNEKTLELPITIHPQWYWSNWMKFIYAVLIGGGLGLIWVFLNNRWKLQQQLQLEKMEASRLKDLDDIKSRFFANVSHELRTPLTLILGPISTMLKDNQISNKQLTLLKTAQQSGRDLLKLVGSILDLSKIESGKLELVENPQVLFPFIRRLVSSFESHAERTKINFIFEYDIPKESCFEIDASKIEIILNNLLSNALKFTQPGGRITFAAKDMENFIQFSVTDTGRGIHKKDLPQVFDRFYQSKLPNAPTEGGTGIGLAVSKEYINLMNGKIWVESEFGKGSTFYVQIPRKEVIGLKPDANELSTVNPDKAIQSIPAPLLTPKKAQHATTILIVEDNYSLREYIDSILSNYHNTILAENGQIALEILSELHLNKQKMPDLVLSDIMMPVMDGYKLVKVLKSKDHFRNLPIVMLTARANLEDRLSALRVGVDDYLLKPFEEEELVVRITNLLKNSLERKSFQTTIEAADAPITIAEKPESEKEPKPIPTPEEKTISKQDQEWLALLEKTILEHLSDSRFNMDFLGEKMFSSRRQLQRKVKKVVGLTPKEYIKEIRLFEARKLLESGKAISVKATAYEVGFNDPQYFSSQFKERYGKVPSSYLN